MCFKSFYPRISKGGIVVINGLNYASGSTQALNDFLGLNNLKLKTFDFYQIFHISRFNFNEFVN